MDSNWGSSRTFSNVLLRSSINPWIILLCKSWFKTSILLPDSWPKTSLGWSWKQFKSFFVNSILFVVKIANSMPSFSSVFRRWVTKEKGWWKFNHWLKLFDIASLLVWFKASCNWKGVQPHFQALKSILFDNFLRNFVNLLSLID